MKQHHQCFTLKQLNIMKTKKYEIHYGNCAYSAILVTSILSAYLYLAFRLMVNISEMLEFTPGVKLDFHTSSSEERLFKTYAFKKTL